MAELTLQSATVVYDEPVARIKEAGGAYSSWYCDIVSDWVDRLTE